MQRTHIDKIKKHIGEKAKIAGFVQTIRDQGNIKFLLVRDVTGILQVVVTKDKKEAMQAAEEISHESVIEVKGNVKEEGQAPGSVEMEAEEVNILSLSDPELPIPVVEKGQKSETEQSVRLDWRWIDLRKKNNTLIFKVWSAMESAFRNYCIDNGYIQVHSPKIIAAASESGAEVFEIKYFDRKAYLAQSPQFYKQMAMAAGFEKVFEIGPVFRAEPSFTSRHATEFTGYDAEISYIESHKDIMEEEEKMLQAVIKEVKETYGEEIKEMFGREVVVPSIPFPKISMKEAKKILSEMNIEGEKEGDICPEEETKISEYAREKFGHEFVFITDYPSEVRPFYHMRDENDQSLTKSFDLLWNGVEITTGAQREHRYEKLLSQAKEKDMDIESLQFYLDFFRYGCPPHGGIGLGPSRMIMKLLGINNVRDATFIYRGVKRIKP